MIPPYEEGYYDHYINMDVEQLNPDKYQSFCFTIDRLRVLLRKLEHKEESDIYWQSFHTTPEIDKDDAWFLKHAITDYLEAYRELVGDYEGGEEL